MVNNPFLFIVAILQFLASIYYWFTEKYMFGYLMLLYGLSNIVLLLMKGE